MSSIKIEEVRRVQKCISDIEALVKRLDKLEVEIKDLRKDIVKDEENGVKKSRFNITTSIAILSLLITLGQLMYIIYMYLA